MLDEMKAQPVSGARRHHSDDKGGGPRAAERASAPEAPPAEAVEVDTARAEVLDRLMHAWQARMTGSISPAALMLAFMDWGMHLANAPGKQGMLVEKAVRKSVRLALHSSRGLVDRHCPPCIEPLPQDRRFRDATWQDAPYKYLYQAFLLQQQWWHNATTGIRGVAPRHENIVAF